MILNTFLPSPCGAILLLFLAGRSPLFYILCSVIGDQLLLIDKAEKVRIVYTNLREILDIALQFLVPN